MLRGNLVGISKNTSKSEQKELDISNTSKISPKKFDFGVNDSALAFEERLL